MEKIEKITKGIENEYDSFKATVEKILTGCPFCKLVSVHYGHKSATVTLEPVGNNLPSANQIEIRYCQECGRFQKEEFSTNLAAKGTFDLLDDNMSAQYYIAAASLLSNKGLLFQLREAMFHFSCNVYELTEALR